MNAYWMGILVVVAIVLLAKVGWGASGQGRAAAKEKIKQGARVIDVRTPGEYQSGHYEGATNIPLHELESRLAEVGARTNAIVVYCASGMRSARAARIMKAAGFKDVTNAGGLGNLKE